MSLQVALKKTQEQLGKAIHDMRELGLKIADATPEAAKELEIQYEKHSAEVGRLMKQADRFESDYRRERELEGRIVNAPPAPPAPGERETHAGKPGGGETNVSQLHRECFAAYIRGGERSVAFVDARERLLSSASPEERHALLSTKNELGGFLTTEDFRAEVVKNAGGLTVMRMAGARVVPTSSSVLVYPSIAGGTDPYSTGFAGSWRAEGAQGTDGTAPARQDQPTFGQERIPVHVWQPDAVVITRELMEDAVVPLESILAQSIAETKGQDEDYAFFQGDGIGRPRGVFDYIAASTGPAITAVNSGSNSTFTYDGLLDLFHTLPIQYRDRAAWFCRSLAFSAILKLKDSTNQPILYAGSIPGTLLGKKVWLTEHAPAVAQNAYPLLFGDVSYYVIAERTDMRLQRLDERFAPNVGFLPTARLGGGVIRTAPFRAQKISA